jgi:8-oxo-dGTP pyrophosphatase MutT (NUDIX family)
MRFQKYIQTSSIKAGVIPYYIDENGATNILLMKPSDPAYGGDKYQIAKGMIDKGESVKETALREGEEELGLIRDNISGDVYLGFDNIQDYALHVYMVRVIDKNNFNNPHYETGSTRWFTSIDSNIREEHIPLIRRCFGKWFFHSTINEWKVHQSYSGRDLIKANETVLWQYIPSEGLLYTYPNGDTYLDKKKLGRMLRSDDPQATHKKQLATFYNKLGFKESNVRQHIESIYETHPRGRIIGNDIYVYSSSMVGMEAKRFNKLIDRAIDAIYDYVDEDKIG